MPVIKDEEIRGYLIEEECICRDCIKQDEVGAMTVNGLILQYEIAREDFRYFCDRCGEEISSL